MTGRSSAPKLAGGGRCGRQFGDGASVARNACGPTILDRARGTYLQSRQQLGALEVGADRLSPAVAVRQEHGLAWALQIDIELLVCCARIVFVGTGQRPRVTEADTVVAIPRSRCALLQGAEQRHPPLGPQPMQHRTAVALHQGGHLGPELLEFGVGELDLGGSRDQVAFLRVGVRLQYGLE